MIKISFAIPTSRLFDIKSKGDDYFYITASYVEMRVYPHKLKDPIRGSYTVGYHAVHTELNPDHANQVEVNLKLEGYDPIVQRMK